MRIEPLQNCPDQLCAVAEIIYNEFVVRTSSQATKEYIMEFLSRPNEKQLPYTLVAISDEKCIGTISIFENDYKNRPQYTPWLASLCVEDNYRNQGIGAKLIDSVIEIARELGHKEIYLKTETAAKYYKRLGWTLVENVTNDSGEESSIFKYCLEGE